MKYKLLKSPQIQYETDEYGKISFLGARVDPELNPDWFEPVIERWRAGIKESRYFVTSDGGLNSGIECNDEMDDAYFESGNYFKTREQAEEASRRIKKVLMDYHKEINGTLK